MLRNLLVCGLLAGLVAGLVATGFAAVAGEPAVDQAIAFEDAHPHAHVVASGHRADAQAPTVARGLQKSFGLLTALLVYGVAFGGLFAIAFAIVYGRIAVASPRATAYWLAAGAFVAVYLVPFAKYPANPPAIGEPSTIGRRTLLYATMLAISLLAALAAVRVRAVVVRRAGGHAATVAALGVFLAIVAAGGAALPGINEVPVTFPATTLWRFRESSVGLQLTLWSVLGLTFGYSAQRVMSGQRVFGRRQTAVVARASNGQGA